MAVDFVETETNVMRSVVTREPINYDQCCLFNDTTVHGCGPTLRCESYR